MIPTTKPWQAIVNSNTISVHAAVANHLSVVKSDASAIPATFEGRVVNTKRYSFDDNGGRYLGL